MHSYSYRLCPELIVAIVMDTDYINFLLLQTPVAFCPTWIILEFGPFVEHTVN